MWVNLLNLIENVQARVEEVFPAPTAAVNLNLGFMVLKMFGLIHSDKLGNIIPETLTEKVDGLSNLFYGREGETH